MESLTLNEGHSFRRYQDRPQSKDQRHRPSRLPTPDTSRSSNDSQSPPESGSLDFPTVTKFGLAGLPDGVGQQRRDSRYSAGQYSPPYRPDDMQRPSLPPIKTVLGDNIASPPTTPSPHGTPMQPSPHEPLYTALAYKPSSLYPNKKQRTEPFPSLGPQYATANRSGSHFAPSATLEPQPTGSSMGPNMQFPPMSQINTVDSRRASSSHNSPPWSSHYPPSKVAAASHYQTPAPTPTSAVMEPFPRMTTLPAPAAQDPFAREMRESFSYNGDRSGPRRPASAYNAYTARPYEREPLRQSPYHPQGVRYSLPVRGSFADNRDSIRYGRTDEQQPRSFGQTTCQGNVPSYFMPSQYEYQHGKARKRSNLPKQSTEIMKTWFDQNIANPYPSEEQKAIFANATGINLTQVSNWFINHRRRCPELRDKRERVRGGSRDCDM
ncbi:unnamed protein product [Zymoseptoria tritici ST99CH_1A5]|uniref:Homeobox domain-containing protein n=1 Tax=Zymoseptoria tritici ST99CH_1A5 TaxID=1276529 RepID=A0A1Y6LDV3_ZYMTR|nr:unnamed protein product [Zymoseptoria tritici ST99CH_1A5]